MNQTELLKAYASGPDRLERSLEGVSPAILVRRPPYDGAWTIKEHVIHLADSEVNNFVRLKSIVAQPRSECYVMQEDDWTRNIARKDEDLGKYLRLFRLVREIAADFAAGEIDSNQEWFVRTYKGETRRIGMREDLELYARHVDFHLEYIERIKAAGA